MPVRVVGVVTKKPWISLAPPTKGVGGYPNYSKWGTLTLSPDGAGPQSHGDSVVGPAGYRPHMKSLLGNLAIIGVARRVQLFWFRCIVD